VGQDGEAADADSRKAPGIYNLSGKHHAQPKMVLTWGVMGLTDKQTST
jgi:hypothetical protein